WVLGALLKRRVEDANDLRRLVIDDRRRLLVPQGRYSHASSVLGFDHLVDFSQRALAVYRVPRRARALGLERPALVGEEVINDIKADRMLETLEESGNERAVCPGTGVRNIEVVAPGFRRER